MRRDSVLLASLLALVLVSLLIAGCTIDDGLPANATPGPTVIPGTTAPETITIPLTAQNMSFNQTTITVPAGVAVRINFTNQDAGVSHNVAIYENERAERSIFIGEITIGPSTVSYTFAAPDEPGIYYFRCDVHPATMNGQFIVAPRPESPFSMER
jgi:plastocyanin